LAPGRPASRALDVAGTRGVVRDGLGFVEEKAVGCPVLWVTVGSPGQGLQRDERAGAVGLPIPGYEIQKPLLFVFVGLGLAPADEAEDEKKAQDNEPVEAVQR
jgi:hypothetical protein